MIARQLIDGAKAVGATLSLEGDRVRCKGTAPDLLARLRAHKAEIAALLRAEALIDEALQAGAIFRLVDLVPREIAEGRPFRIVLR